VFSHASKLALIAHAQDGGFAVVLLVVCMDGLKRLLARGCQRVLEGGHTVPAERILARYPRTLSLLARAVRLPDLAMLYQTGGSDDADKMNLPVRVAVCRRQQTRRLAKRLPQWAKRVLG
jgi:predicted ABC-type ATPase